MAGFDPLRGAWDLHVHAAPDVIPRKQNLVDVAKNAAAAGMAGLLIKSHTLPTAGRNFTLNKLLSTGPRTVGSIALNEPVGGLNPVAVEAFLREGGRVVFMPTYCAANHIRIWGLSQPPTAFPVPSDDYQGIELLRPDGGLKPQVQAIIALVKEHDAVLATGHVSPQEGLAVLRAAKEQGVKRLVATHVSEQVTDYTPAQQAEAIALGAVLEHCFFAITPYCPGGVTLQDILRDIQATGPGSVYLSSDYGQPPNPAPVAGFRQGLEALMALGVSQDDITRMVRDNPARLME